MQKLIITFGIGYVLTACSVTGEQVDQPQATCDSRPSCTHDFDKIIDENIADFHRDQNASLSMPALAKQKNKSFVTGISASCMSENSSSMESCPYSDEKTYLYEKWPPNLGLALSGGGTRSASFAVGVLKALEKQNILDKVDVISSVSGGSYINYWYFSQLFYWDNNCQQSKEKSTGKIFDDFRHVERFRNQS